MASGKAHTTATVIAAAAVGAFVTANGNPEEGMRWSLGILAGALITPDLDVDNGCISHRIVNSLFGVIVGAAWRTYWWFYGKVMPHRSLASHLPVLSTLLRMLYMIPMYKFLVSIGMPPLSHEELATLFWALVISDTLHAFMDIAL